MTPLLPDNAASAAADWLGIHGGRIMVGSGLSGLLSKAMAWDWVSILSVLGILVGVWFGWRKDRRDKDRRADEQAEHRERMRQLSRGHEP